MTKICSYLISGVQYGADPDGVAAYADFPKFEADLHARHTWLVTKGVQILQDNRDDPDFFDVKIAGYWAWGLNNWRGRGWCAKAYNEQDKRVWRQLPSVSRSGFMRKGVEFYSEEDVFPSNIGIVQYFYALAHRLKNVVVTSGDWQRVIKPGMSTNLGETGVFFDPPYSAEAKRDNNLYAQESKTVAQDVYRWCREHEYEPGVRIALCGYEGEFEFPDSWTTLEWSTTGGLGNTKRTNSDKRGKENKARERIWLSPNCLPITE
jgi:DNA adenine methylase